MIYKWDILKIINQELYNNSFNELEDKVYIDKEEELLIITDCIYIRFSYNKNILYLDEIILSDKIKGKKVCFNLIGKLIDYCKNSSIELFQVSSIVSKKMINICKYYNMSHSDDAVYGDISKDYDFDGYLGNMKIITK